MLFFFSILDDDASLSIKKTFADRSLFKYKQLKTFIHERLTRYLFESKVILCFKSGE